MTDQADDLRQLVLRNARSTPSTAQDPPHIIVLTSGKGGVGTTTIAVNLAAALARDGHRTVLVDADFQSADATKLSHVDATDTIADVLSGRRSVHEALERGPAGILVLPGAWGRGDLIDCSEAAQQRLLTQLVHLGAHADFVIIDVGSGVGRAAARFWAAADRIVVVTTPEAMAIMDTYALVKTMSNPQRENVATLVNLSLSAQVADDAHARLARASKRFLGLALTSYGAIDEHAAIALATADCRLLSATESDSSATTAFERLAATVEQSLPTRQPTRVAA